MAEETNQEQNEEVKEAPQPDPVELEAREHGWKPEEEFKADEKNAGKKWRTAEDFMERKSFFDRIESSSKEIKNLKKGMEAFSQHYANVEKAAYERALKELKEKRRALIEEGEHGKAEDVLEEIDEVKDKMRNVQPPVKVDNGPPQEFLRWKEKNTWYTTDDRMTRYADKYGEEMARKGYGPDEVLKAVEKEIREVFPDKFRNTNRDSAPEMVGGSKKSTKSDDGFRLSAEEERILSNMIKGGAPITREQYIKDLKQQRGV